MFCENCGKDLPDGAKFCNGCGAVTEPVQPAYAAAEPAPARPVPPPPAYTPPAQPVYAPQQPPAYMPPPQTAPPYQQAYAPQQPPAYSGQPGSEPLRVGQYIGMLLLMLVPLLSVILLFVWSFGGSVNLNKKNYARAMLIVSAIGAVLSIIFSTALIGIVGELFGGYY